MIPAPGDPAIPRAKLELMAIVSNEFIPTTSNQSIFALHSTKAIISRSVRPRRNASVFRRDPHSESGSSTDELEDWNPTYTVPYHSSNSIRPSSVRRCAKRIRATLLFLELEVSHTRTQKKQIAVPESRCTRLPPASS